MTDEKAGQASDAGWPTTVSDALGHLAKMGKDTFVFGLIVIATMVALAFGAGWPAIGGGISFVSLYIIFRERLFGLQMRERVALLQHGTTREAERIIDGTATSNEKLELAEYEEAVRVAEQHERKRAP